MPTTPHPQPERQAAAVWGSLVADAAALGLHWIYDPAHIQLIAPQTPEFLAPDSRNYAGVKSYYAHGNRQPGDQTQYGYQTLVMLETLADLGGQFDLATYQRLWHARFAHGAFDGYRDAAIRETLGHLDHATQGDARSPAYGIPQGARDDQLPALAKLPPLVAARAHSPDLLESAEAAVRATNDHPTAIAYGRFATRLLQQLMSSTDLGTALDLALRGADADVVDAIGHARKRGGEDPIAFAQEVGLDCHLEHGVPVVIQNLCGAQGYADAVRRNLYTGGDSAGRGVFLGALAGAYYGLDPADGIPAEWIARLKCREIAETWIKAAFPQM